MHEWTIVVVIGLITCLVWAGYSESKLSPEVQALMLEARAGAVEPQFRIGNAYASGEGAPRNQAKAMTWYRRAAEAGHPAAKYSVGGRLLPSLRHHAESMELYRRAASQNYAPAINELGYIYEYGIGAVMPDRERAYELYLRAAELGWRSRC